MRKQMIANALVLSIFVSSLTGCGYYKTDGLSEEPAEVQKAEQYYDSSETVADHVSEATVHILIDQSGYACGDQKKAIFVGEDLSGSFSVIDASTKEAVFEGTMVSKGQSDALNSEIWEGDFSDVTQKGTFYISTQKLGQSYSFEVGDNVYQSRSDALYDSLRQIAWSKRDSFEKQDVAAISSLLLTYEMYGDTEDVAFFKPFIEYIDKWDAIDTLTEKQRFLLSGLMAQMSYTYQNVDSTVARDYLTRARAAYAQGKLLDCEEAYFAASQLYKASGEKRYQSDLQQFLKQASESVSENEIDSSDMQFLGDIAYLTTTYKVDQTVCEQLMQECLKKAETISIEAGKSKLRMTDETNQEQLFEHMMLLAIVDYAIVSYEYLTWLKEDIHYLYGKGFMQDISELSDREKAYLYFILEHITQREEKHS